MTTEALDGALRTAIAALGAPPGAALSRAALSRAALSRAAPSRAAPSRAAPSRAALSRVDHGQSLVYNRSKPGIAHDQPQGRDDPVRTGSALTVGAALELFDAQATSRHLDVAARDLQASGRGYYTIGSAGHESNAAVALALRPTDPALLHYRSGGFYQARANQVAESTPVRDVLQGLMCAADEPIAGGRHKVYGNHALAVIPQTSTIASHLPRAVGLAVTLHRAVKLGITPPWPDDSVVVCSFGDASANHSTATGAINTALHTAYQQLPVPILFVCEDNGFGISVRTPEGWIQRAYGARPGLAYFAADGFDPAQTYDAALAAAGHVRQTRTPAFLHLSTVRFLGHAGSDAEISYRTTTQVEADYSRDPLLGTARTLVAAGAASPPELLARYDEAAAAVADTVTHLGEVPILRSADRIMAPLASRRPTAVAEAVAELADVTAKPPSSHMIMSVRRSMSPQNPHDHGDGLTLAASINAALSDIMAADQRVMLFGEDVGRKGGVYGVTRGLARRFGAGRVFDTLLDEQSILGLALGAGVAGMVPIPEIQYLAYLHNAEDQLRGEAATVSFFSQGQYRNPMVLRLPGLGYQKGFGGHFHNDNAVGVLRDIPGLVVACPARGRDAADMMRTCWAAAVADGTVSVFLEPIALYHTRHLYEPDDDGWLDAYARPEVWADAHVPIGRARTYGDGTDLTMVTFGNGVPMSLRATRRLAERGLQARVLDLRWLAPLPVDDLLDAAAASGRVLVVDETRRSGGVAEGVLAALVDGGFTGTMARVASRDSFVPLGPAARDVLLSEDDIEAAALRLAAGDSQGDR